MTTISYFRAGISCLPYVGPFVQLYNRYELTKDFNTMTVEWESSPQRGVTAKVNAMRLDYDKKGVAYSNYAVSSYLLTLATTIGFIASGILTPLTGSIVIGAYIALALLQNKIFNCINKKESTPL